MNCPIHSVELTETCTRWGARYSCPEFGCTVVWWSGGRTSTPADAETRALRHRCHEAFDRLWVTAKKRNRGRRRQRAYDRLANAMGLRREHTHFGMFDAAQCLLALEIIPTLSVTKGSPSMSGSSQPRVGDWIQTYTRRRFWPLDPRPADFAIEDIAHALSNLCRFTGHCRSFYSVAQHSVLVAWAVEAVARDDRRLQLTALLHDAAEAYIGDINRPLKRQEGMSAYRAIEARIEAALAERFDLIHPMPAAVKDADNRLLVTEARDLLSGGPLGKDGQADGWRHTPAEFPPLSFEIEPWSQERSETEFLRMFEQLTGVPVGAAAEGGAS